MHLYFFFLEGSSPRPPILSGESYRLSHDVCKYHPSNTKAISPARADLALIDGSESTEKLF